MSYVPNRTQQCSVVSPVWISALFEFPGEEDEGNRMDNDDEDEDDDDNNNNNSQ